MDLGEIELETNSANEVTAPQIENISEEKFDITLRPKTLNEYIGQEKIKENLDIFITAARNREEPLEHCLLYGPPGIGKTTLSMIIGNEMGTGVKITSGPAIERPGDLAAILTNLNKGDILFIDEIHRLSRIVEEILYPAMEDRVLDIMVGKGPGARSIRIDLNPFTIIGATTKAGMLSSPLRDRFGNIFSLDFYNDNEIGKIVKRSADILETKIEKDAIEELSKRSRYVPRIANRLLRRTRDFAEVKHDGVITKEITDQSLEALGVDCMGLDKGDRKILKVLATNFNGGPVGITTIAAATAEDRETIEDIYEPYLLRIGFLERTPRGRKITAKALKHLGIDKMQ